METIKQTKEQENQKAEKIQEILNRPTVIGVEGGPCSGKTTFVDSLIGSESQTGPVVVLPEAARQIIEKYRSKGVDIIKLAKKHPDVLFKFEAEVMGLTLDQIKNAREDYFGTGAVIVADRVDIGGYMGESEHQQILEKFGLRQAPMFDLVDKILYFPTLAKKDKEEYLRLLHQDPCRAETPEEAIEICDATLKSTSLHPEFHYMDQGSFKSSLEAAKNYILNPENEFEKGGYLFGNFDEATRIINSKKDKGLMISESYVFQQYNECQNVNYRIRAEEIVGKNPKHKFSLSIKDKNANKEIQKTISKEECQFLACAEDPQRIEKARFRFLHQDENTGAWNVWSLDNIRKIGWYINHGWAFEVESHDQESLESIKPPFEYFVDKKYSSEDLAKKALMFS